MCSSEVVSMWSELHRSPYINEQRVVYHPGEVSQHGLGRCGDLEVHT